MHGNDQLLFQELAYILLSERPTVHYHHAGKTRALYIGLYSTFLNGNQQFITIMQVGPELFILAYILLPERPTVHYHACMVGPELFILAYNLLPERPTVHYHHAGRTRALYISLYSPS